MLHYQGAVDDGRLICAKVDGLRVGTTEGAANDGRRVDTKL